VNDIKLKDATLDDIMDEVRERYSWAGVGCGLTVITTDADVLVHQDARVKDLDLMQKYLKVLVSQG
jgi:hypothetical protein